MKYIIFIICHYTFRVENMPNYLFRKIVTLSIQFLFYSRTP